MKSRFINLKETYDLVPEGVKTYLLDEKINVSLYQDTTIGYQGIVIEFISEYKNNASSFKFYYSTNEDFSNAKIIDVDKTSSSVTLFNLLKNQKYYIKLSAIVDGIECDGITDCFLTASYGPRPIRVPGIDNVRDEGGYMTNYGKRTLQNMLFRGPEMNGSHNLALTDEGQKVMSEELAIKFDCDLRNPEDSGNTTISPIKGARLEYFPLGPYTNFFTSPSTKEQVRKIISRLAHKENYPAYIHCWGGADRTGTLCLIINGLCGVSEVDLIHDYEYTTFSLFSLRTSKQNDNYKFYEFLEELKTKYKGNTLQDKIKAYLSEICVSETDMNSLIAIMCGEVI